MAKLSLINRDIKRTKLVEKYSAKRAALKAIIDDQTRSDEDRYQARLQLQEHVSVRTDFPESTLPALVQSHHLMVLPYRDSQKIRLMGRLYATSGALAWAIACGRGALVSDARAMPSEVAFGNGAAFVQQDPGALAAWLIRLVEQPQQVTDWANAAATLAKSRTWPEIARCYHEVFERAALGNGQ